jgi:hypothetical protein
VCLPDQRLHHETTYLIEVVSSAIAIQLNHDTEERNAVGRQEIFTSLRLEKHDELVLSAISYYTGCDTDTDERSLCPREQHVNLRD